jgi:hypothetical protein
LGLGLKFCVGFGLLVKRLVFIDYLGIGKIGGWIILIYVPKWVGDSIFKIKTIRVSLARVIIFFRVIRIYVVRTFIGKLIRLHIQIDFLTLGL